MGGCLLKKMNVPPSLPDTEQQEEATHSLESTYRRALPTYLHWPAPPARPRVQGAEDLWYEVLPRSTEITGP